MADPNAAGAEDAFDGMSPARPARLIARIWRGRTAAAKAEEYTFYLFEHGVRKIQAIAGNRGVQMLRAVGDETADFEVVSYWDSIEAIKGFAGEDYREVRHLPRDPEYMIGTPPTVEHFEVVVDDRRRR